MRVTAIFLAIVGVVLWARSDYVFDTCGYDCGIVPGVATGWGLIPAIGNLFAYVFFFVAVLLFVIHVIRRRRAATAMGAFTSNEEFFQFVRHSILRMQATGHSQAALHLSNGFGCMNGLTDGWFDFLESVQNTQAQFGSSLPLEQQEALERIRATIQRAVDRR